jgi:hypothetical protein
MGYLPCAQLREVAVYNIKALRVCTLACNSCGVLRSST